MSEWERSQIIIPLQKKLATVDFLAELLGLSVSGEFILPLFSTLYWCLDAHKCNAGIWLVPVSEIANGLIKWLFRRGRPGWVDSRVRIAPEIELDQGFDGCVRSVSRISHVFFHSFSEFN